MWLSARFMDASGPLTTLSPTVTVYNMTDGTTDVAAAAMAAVGSGIYKYNFSTANRSKDYAFVCDGGAAITSPFLRYVYGAIDADDVQKLTANKVTKSGTIISIYEADGATVWRRYNLANGGRVVV